MLIFGRDDAFAMPPFAAFASFLSLVDGFISMLLR